MNAPALQLFYLGSQSFFWADLLLPLPLAFAHFRRHQLRTASASDAFRSLPLCPCRDFGRSNLLALHRAALQKAWAVHRPEHKRRFFIPSIGPAGQFALGLTAVLIACGSLLRESEGRAGDTGPRLAISWTSLEKISAMRSKKSRPAQTDRVRSRRPAERPRLVGDSHAHHYLPLISTIYGGGTAYITGGCLPGQGAQLITRSGLPFNDSCQENNQYVMERILTLTPKIVVLASRWTQIEDLPYGREGRPTLYLLTKKPKRPGRRAGRPLPAPSIKQSQHSRLQASRLC